MLLPIIWRNVGPLEELADALDGDWVECRRAGAHGHPAVLVVLVGNVQRRNTLDHPRDRELDAFAIRTAEQGDDLLAAIAGDDVTGAYR